VTSRGGQSELVEDCALENFPLNLLTKESGEDREVKKQKKSLPKLPGWLAKQY